MKTQHCSLVILSVLLSSIALLAQTSSPTLTTQDVVKWRAANPDRVEILVAKQDAEHTLRQTRAQVDADFVAAEKEWNLRLSDARARVKAFERRADLALLEAAQARNVIFHNDATALNRNNARVTELKALAKAYNAEAEAAQTAVNQLLDEGRAQGYQLYTLAPTLPNGEPNLEYYRTRFLALHRDLQDAQAHAAALQLRANRVQTTIHSTWNFVLAPSQHGILFYPNNGAADVFYLNRLRDKFGGISGDWQTTQARIAILTEQLEDLREAGRRAGVPPGIFR
jgi:hypothetical protein